MRQCKTCLPKKCYAPKMYQKDLFAWCPDTTVKTRNEGGGNIPRVIKNLGCSAIPYSQGYDWNSTYSYNTVIGENGLLQRSAYVACDYVQ